MEAQSSARPWLARHRLALIVALGLAVSLPALGVGFVLDDVLHRAVLEGLVSDYEFGWFNLYEFTSAQNGAARLRAQGSMPWFTDGELRLRFFRPLSSFLLVLDHRLFANNALPAHLHSLAWFAAIAATFAALMRRWFREPAALLIALLWSAFRHGPSRLRWLVTCTTCTW